MMFKLLAALVLCGWQVLAPTLVSAQEPGALRVDAERQRIMQERAHHEAVFLQAEQACYGRFAVSDCLRQARRVRRERLDGLRRQELLVNDRDRQSKGVDALDRIQDNVSAQKHKQSERDVKP